MKKRGLSSLILGLGLLTGGLFASVQEAQAQTARLQVIHNAADPALDTVDVWVNNTKLLENFVFRTATPYIDVPANTDLQVRLKGAGSADTINPVFFRTYNLPANGTFVLVANGVANPASFTANPDGRSIGFNLWANEGSENSVSDSTDILVIHGATDAPTVDVVARGVGTLVNNAAYGDIAGYLRVPAIDYTLDITDASGATTVASFTAPLSAFEDSSLVVLASGFLGGAPQGPAFGLLAVTAKGRAILLPAATPQAQTARLQVIHNAADPALDTVDVWVNNTKLLENFVFRTATPYIDVPANTDLQVRLKGAGSADTINPVFFRTYNLPANGTFVLVANGVANPASFTANPDGRSIGFNLWANEGSENSVSDSTDILVIHGATDAPTVDVVARGVGTLVNNAAYGDIAGYLRVPAIDYTLDITDASGATTVASFTAPLSAFEDSSLVVLASGFLGGAPQGPAFGLLAVTAKGRAILLPAATPQAQTARLQVIHNAADPALDTVDVWVNNTKLLENFVFRTATPYIDVPANTDLQVRLKGAGSADTTNPVFFRTYNLPANGTFVLVANGVANPASFTANPDGRVIGFNLWANEGSESSVSDSTDILVIHGATDAPTVDVVARGVGTLVNNAAYGDIAGYLRVPAIDYTLDITDASGATTVASFTAPLSAFEDSSLVVLASGFLGGAPQGPAFGLLAVTAKGRAILLPLATGLAVNANNRFRMYPNPARNQVRLEFTESLANTAQIQVFDATGKRVLNTEVSGSETLLDLNGLAAGMYQVLVQDGAVRSQQRLVIE